MQRIQRSNRHGLSDFLEWRRSFFPPRCVFFNQSLKIKKRRFAIFKQGRSERKFQNTNWLKTALSCPDLNCIFFLFCLFVFAFRFESKRYEWNSQWCLEDVVATVRQLIRNGQQNLPNAITEQMKTARHLPSKILPFDPHFCLPTDSLIDQDMSERVGNLRMNRIRWKVRKVTRQAKR